MKIQNIVFVCNYAADYAGNFIEGLKQLHRMLKSRGITCNYLLPIDAENKEWVKDLEKEVKVVFCDFSPRTLFSTLKKTLKHNTLIHTHFIGARETFAVRKAGKHFNSVIIYNMHNRYGENDNCIRKIIKRIIYHNVFFIGVSKAVYDDLCCVFDKKKCYCVPNAISLDRLSNANYFRNDSNIIKLLILGTHFIRKGTDLAIEAVSNIQSTKKIELEIIAHDIEQTQNRIKKILGFIPDNISVHLPVENIKEVYEKTDIFLAPARSEAFGYAVVEALYCGCEVIASDIPGQNTMKDIVGIRWIQSENVEELQQAIIEEINSKYDISKKEKQRAYIEENYSLSAWCRKILKVYEMVCSSQI